MKQLQVMMRMQQCSDINEKIVYQEANENNDVTNSFYDNCNEKTVDTLLDNHNTADKLFTEA